MPRRAEGFPNTAGCKSYGGGTMLSGINSGIEKRRRIKLFSEAGYPSPYSYEGKNCIGIIRSFALRNYWKLAEDQIVEGLPGYGCSPQNEVSRLTHEQLIVVGDFMKTLGFVFPE